MAFRARKVFGTVEKQASGTATPTPQIKNLIGRVSEEK